jgi:hypothetical protein
MIDQNCTTQHSLTNRREFLLRTGAAVVAAAAAPTVFARTGFAQPEAPAKPAGGGTIIDFERELKRMRFEFYRHPKIDILKEGFRPVGGKVADFATARLDGRDHFFYIERRLQEGTPFYPGHEIYFGHASTPDFFEWEVHDPVMIVRENSWEEAHVWAPVILPDRGEFIMAYTGLNRELSQNIGLASSRDLFHWKRWKSNPISPCKGAKWAYWTEDDICSCRDPDLVRYDDRVWMSYTANTKEGASCIALTSTTDFKKWKDHGPIIVGPTSGYEPKLTGGHAQGSFESASLSYRHGRWLLICKVPNRDKRARTWAGASDRIDSFQMDKMWPFWKEGICVEVVRSEGTRSLIAGMVGGYLKFAEVDWAEEQPVARNVTDRETLRRWNAV